MKVFLLEFFEGQVMQNTLFLKKQTKKKALTQSGNNPLVMSQRVTDASHKPSKTSLFLSSSNRGEGPTEQQVQEEAKI